MSNLAARDVTDLTYYTYNQVRAYLILEVAASVSSVVVGSIALFLWFKMDPSRRVLFRLELLLALIISDFFKAFFILCVGCIRLNSFNRDVHMDSYASQFCDGWGYLKQSVTVCTDLIIIMLTIHNALMIFFPQLSRLHERVPVNFTKIFKKFGLCLKGKMEFKDIFKKNPDEVIIVNEGGIYPLRWYVVFVVFIISFLFSGLIFVNGGHYQYNFSCSAPQHPVWKRLLAGWIIRYINLITIVCVYSFIIIYLNVHFRDIERSKKKLYHLDTSTQDYSQPEPLNDVANVTNTLQKELMNITAANNAKKRNAITREMKSFAAYPIGYWIIWITPTISQIYNYIDSEKREPVALLVFVAFMVPFSCTVNSIIFFVRERPWNATSQALAERNMSSPTRFRPSFYRGGPDDGDDLEKTENTAADPIELHRNNIEYPHQLGFTPDPELGYNHIDYGAQNDESKLRQDSFASSNMRTLVESSKRPSIHPRLSSVPDNEVSLASGGGLSSNQRSGNTSNGSGSSGSNTTAAEDDSGVDMIDFLRGN